VEPGHVQSPPARDDNACADGASIAKCLRGHLRPTRVTQTRAFVQKSHRFIRAINATTTARCRIQPLRLQSLSKRDTPLFDNYECRLYTRTGCMPPPPIQICFQFAVRCGNMTGPYIRWAFHSMPANGERNVGAGCRHALSYVLGLCCEVNGRGCMSVPHGLPGEPGRSRCCARRYPPVR